MRSAVTVLCSTAVMAAALAAPAVGAQLEPCEVPDGWECGSIQVRIDRSDPSLGTTAVDFAVRRHDGGGPAAGTLLATDAPRVGSIELAWGYFEFVSSDLLDTHDLVVVDPRGTGADPLDCHDYQHGVGPFTSSVAACAAQMGPARDFYTYGDLADDLDAVRAELGLDRVDLYATGHATPVIEAYAVRHPARVHSAVIDSAADLALWPDEDLSNALGVVAKVCRRSPLCSSSIPNPEKEMRRLAHRLHRAPVKGVGYDALGEPHRIELTEAKLAYLLLFDKSGPARTQAELPAAAIALRRGDPVPLLRLAAENDGPMPGDPDDQGDPALESVASENAAYCAQWPMPWDRRASRETRLAQYATARAKLSTRVFAPFSLDAALGWLPDEQCLSWPEPARENPIAPRGARYPDVPVLVIHGDLNTDHPLLHGRRVAARFPRGRLVAFEQAGQSAAGWSGCARRIMARFMTTLRVGDTRCPPDERPVVPGLDAFTLRVADAVPSHVERAPGDRSTGHDRKVVAVAVATYLDAVYTALFRESDDAGRGLRGGTYDIEFRQDGMALALHDVRFAQDLPVSGSGVVGFGGAPNSGTLTVPGGVIDLGDEALLSGSGRLHVGGRIGGRRFRLAVQIH